MTKSWLCAWCLLPAAGAMASAVAACSSSSADGATSNDASAPGGDAAVTVATDAGDAGAEPVGRGLSLTWKVTTPVVSARPPGEGARDAGPLDSGLALVAGDVLSDAGADAASAPPDVPVPGAKACVYQSTTIACATTDANGLFTLTGLPGTTDLAVSIVKDGYRSVLRALQTASTDMDGTDSPISLQSSTLADPTFSPAIDWQNKGLVSFFAIGPLPDAGPTAFGADYGATFALAPAVGDGPYFLRNDGTYEPDASSFVGVAAIYDNLPAGTYKATIDDPRHDCAPIRSPFGRYGYPESQLTVSFPVVPGYFTGPVGFFCTNKIGIVDAGI